MSENTNAKITPEKKEQAYKAAEIVSRLPETYAREALLVVKCIELLAAQQNARVTHAAAH